MKSNKKTTKQNVNQQVSTAVLENMRVSAQAYLNSGKFSSAIDLLKKLKKHEPEAHWNHLLADAYKGRIKELIATGMFKEGLLLCQVRATTCELPVVDDLYVELVILLKQWSTAVDLLSAPALEPDLTQRLERFLLPWLLTLPEEKRNSLSESVVQFKDSEAVCQALACYSASDDAGLQQALKKISFRSPFRDVSWLLNGLLKFAQGDSAEAAKMLAQVQPDTCFPGLRRLLADALLSELQWFKEISAMPDGYCDALLRVLGYSIELHPYIKEMAQALTSSNAGDLAMDVLLKYHKILPKEYLQEIGCAIVPVAKTNRLGSLKKVAGPLSPWDSLHIQALYLNHQYESENSPFFSISNIVENIRSWGALLVRSQQENKPSEVISLIYANILKILGINDDFVPRLIVSLIEKTGELYIQHDPQRWESYAEMIGFYKRIKKPDQCKLLIEEALTHIPDCIPALLLQLEDALQDGNMQPLLDLTNKIRLVDSLDNSIKLKIRYTLMQSIYAATEEQLDDAWLEMVQQLSNSPEEQWQVDIVRVLFRRAPPDILVALQENADRSQATALRLMIYGIAERIGTIPPALLHSCMGTVLPPFHPAEVDSVCKVISVLSRNGTIDFGKEGMAEWNNWLSSPEMTPVLLKKIVVHLTICEQSNLVNNMLPFFNSESAEGTIVDCIHIVHLMTVRHCCRGSFLNVLDKAYEIVATLEDKERVILSRFIMEKIKNVENNTVFPPIEFENDCDSHDDEDDSEFCDDIDFCDDSMDIDFIPKSDVSGLIDFVSSISGNSSDTVTGMKVSQLRTYFNELVKLNPRF